MTTLRLRYAFAGLLAVCLLALGATDAQATHFRYGTMRWEVIPTVPPNQPGQTRIKVTSESAWRRSFAWPGGATPTLGVPLNTGQSVIVQRTLDNGNVGSPVPLMVTPSSINSGEDWFVGDTLIEFQFATTNLPVRIFYQGAARVSNLADLNDDLNFRVESVMSATPNAASPVASILPIITVGFPLPAATFFIPAGDVEGDTLTWSIAPNGPFPVPNRSMLFKAAPDGFDDIPPPTLSINPTTGEVTWITELERSPNDPQGPIFSEFYAVQFIVRDSKGGETPVDAFLRLRQVVPNAPVATINGSENQHLVSVRPNNPVMFTLTGTDNDAGATVTLTSGNLPPGASMTPSLPTVGSSPQSSTFNWTPTLAQAGNSYTVAFAVTDEFGNQDTISAVITVLENFAPTVTCPAETTAEATGPAGADNVTLDATVGDIDPDPLTIRWFVDGALVETDTATGPGNTVVSMTRSYAFLPAPLHTIRVEVTDGQATRECTTTVTVVDTTPPTITPMPDIVLEATGPGGAVATWTDPTATDIVDGIRPVTCVPASGTLFPVTPPAPVTTVRCTASDTRGNTAEELFTVTVRDTTAPVVTAGPDQTLEATSPQGAVANFTATAVDLVDGPITPTCTPPSGSTFPLGTTEVDCEATDSHGNTGSDSLNITVVDTTPPVITNNPGNQVREATGPSGAAVSWPPLIATDIADPNVPVICDPASGSTFAITPPAPIATVLCTATDDSGNFSTATFTVRVQDTTPPVISNMPANITVPAMGSGAFVSWPSPTAFDLVDLARPVTCVPASGTFFPLGTTTVNCTASDTRLNTSTASFTVTVTSGDTKPPKVCLKLSPGTLWPPNHKMRNIRVTLTVRDNQDPTPTCAITSVTSTEPVTGTRYGNTTPDWIFNGLDLQLRAERYSKHGRTYTVTVLCSDDSGNTATARGTVRVPHSQGHHLFEQNDTNNNNQSGHCCVRRDDRDRDRDDDDDDGHFTWTNGPGELTDSTNKGPDDHNNRCFDEDQDDDDDDHDNDDDDDHLTIKTDGTEPN